MTRPIRVVLVGVVTVIVAACGDDGGTSVDASQANDASGQAMSDAAPPVDGTPPPVDASAVGRACGLPNGAITLSMAGAVGLGMICFDPATGDNCRIIDQGQISCFNDQEGFAFGYHSGMDIRSVAPSSGMTITGFTGSGTMMGASIINVTNLTSGSVTGQTSTGQSYTLQYRFNGFTVELPSMSGP